MIDVEKLKNVKRLVTHANCPDGVASALIVKDALPDVEVLFVKHGTEEHQNLASLPGTLFCDFTPWMPSKPNFLGENVAELQAAMTRVWIEAGAIVLDHHPTQRELTMAFVEAGLGAYGENDRNECGAWLAYEHVWAPLLREKALNEHLSIPEVGHRLHSVQEFAELAAIRDTWKRGDPRFEEASRQANMLTFLPERLRREIPLADALAFCKDEKLAAIVREREIDHAHKVIQEGATFTTSKGTRVLIFQGVTPTSDAAEILESDQSYRPGPHGDPPDIVVGFHYFHSTPSQLLLQFSTRSHTGYDVGAFCKAHGGGGHKAAAGFTVEQSAELGASPYAVFKNLLEQWEAR